jgi:tetratricopeptide (TPR) repeat protein
MIKLKGYENVPSIMLYSKLLNLYTDSENEDNYFSLRQSVSENNPLFPKKELAEIYSTIINYCSIQINKGNSKFLAQLFDFYKEVVSQDILLEDQSFSPYHFKNIVVIGLRLKEFNWIEAFITDYAPLLPENQRDNSLSFNLAQLYFYQKKYDLVIKTLQSVEYDDYIYNLNSKTMLICTYYDTGETDALFFLLDSFRAFLNRNNHIPDNRKELYRNFVSIAKKLAKMTPKDEKAKQKLTLELEQTKNVASKNWLLEKLAEL